MIAILPLWAMCDRWDIGGLSTNLHFQTGRPTVFVYDGHPGGVGIARRGYDELEGWVGDTEQLLAGCPCADGCPSCVQSPKCGNLNEFLDKAGALALLAPHARVGLGGVGGTPLGLLAGAWRAPHQLAAAVGADRGHRVRARRTERALEAADPRLAVRGERRAAAFALGAHLQGHG